MKKLSACLLVFISSIGVNAQDTQFSQYFSASLYLNPGFAGVYNYPTLNFNHKRQVPTGPVVAELTQVSFIFPVKPQGKLEKSIGGVGLMAFNERSGFDGVYENNGAFLTYANNFKFGILTSDVFSLGLQVGYESRSSSYSGLVWGSQYNPFVGGYDFASDPTAGVEFGERQSNLIVNAGIMYYYNPERNYLLYSYSAFSGFSATNLNKPNRSFVSQSEDKAAMLLKYNGGLEMKFNKIFVTPSLLIQYLQKNYQFNAGVLISYSPAASRYQAIGPQLLIGTWYRYRDSFILMGGVKVKSLVFRASYDLNTQLFFADKNVEFGKNSFEISVQYALTGDQGIRKVSNPLF
ncbi:MAG: type IX secretion system membrane protein PorP/SprF [Cytophagales bacterium]|nr:type IX secretion system membrane protein PorP/SprF [Cytophagales bacterium]